MTDLCDGCAFRDVCTSKNLEKSKCKPRKRMAEYIRRADAIALFWPVDQENDGSDGCTIIAESRQYSSDDIEAMLSELPAACGARMDKEDEHETD